ncbi:hypothetical protein [Peribacillus sp. NPDC058075]|uniref:hypothetical protein n=1 Tax=unclassified Peribacillus TaxID=2675266 RepID=UPI0036D92D82
MTVPKFFGNRFHSKKVRLAAAITTILGIAAYLVAVTQGAAVLLAEVTRGFLSNGPGDHVGRVFILYHSLRCEGGHGK